MVSKYKRIAFLWARDKNIILPTQLLGRKKIPDFSTFTESDFVSLFNFYVRLETSRNEFRRTPKPIRGYAAFRGDLMASFGAPKYNGSKIKHGEIMQIERTDTQPKGAHGYISPRHSIHYKNKKMGKTQGS